MAVTKDEVKDFIKNMTLMEAAELVKELEEELGVSAAAPVAMVAGGAPAAGGGEAAPAEEQTEFTVVLESAGDKKIQVIKEVRAVVSGLGLKEAKALVDGAPATVKEGVSKEEAEEIKSKLEAAGATVSIK
ncbi:MAG: 50S ribosomal protein L7/L12 [Nitrospirae bacterium]|nr:MAG: 50S ribosomal protein L7/L12 [Nitrospirota bacterium]